MSVDIPNSRNFPIRAALSGSVPQNVTTRPRAIRIKSNHQSPGNLWKPIRMLNGNEEDWDSEEWNMKFYTSISIFTIGSINGAVLALLISIVLR
jgi:hypothetical protein